MTCPFPIIYQRSKLKGTDAFYFFQLLKHSVLSSPAVLHKSSIYHSDKISAWTLRLGVAVLLIVLAWRKLAALVSDSGDALARRGVIVPHPVAGNLAALSEESLVLRIC